MQTRSKIRILLAVLLLTVLACTSFDLGGVLDDQPTATPAPPTSTPIVEGGYDPVNASENEPVLVVGTIPFTSPFFINSISEPFVLLEDQAGFAARDEDFVFPLAGQTIGPVWKVNDQTLSFSLSLPSIPQGIFLDLDNDNQKDKGVMVFQVAFWSNTWGGPFLEEREGTGWSGAYSSALVDPERDGEIVGGKLIVWAPDENQQFPNGFGQDNQLFTEDDPLQNIPAGYSIVDLDANPFNIYKEASPEFTLLEGAGEVKDFSSLTRLEAFNAMFERVRLEYPFTKDKNINWDALYAEFAPKIKDAKTSYEYYVALKEFTMRIPDGHIGLGFTDDANQLFFETVGGGFGMILSELSDGQVIVTRVYPGYPAQRAGIQPGAEIITWNGQPVSAAIGLVEPFLGPYSTEQHRRLEQVAFLTRYPAGTKITVSYANPSGSQQLVELTAEIDYDSIFDAIPYFAEDPLALPVEAQVLEGNIGYMKISTFSDDYNLMAQVYEYHLEKLIDSGDLKGLILDLRVNLGGNGALASDFFGYFISEEIKVSRHAYYNHDLGEFEYGDEPATIKPGPLNYSGPVVLLVSPYCFSACEGFAYWFSLNNRATIIGHAGTAGAFGEVGRGQYNLPGDISLQVPTGRPETLSGELLIEGAGVLPDMVIPITYQSAMGQVDAVLQAALEVLN